MSLGGVQEAVAGPQDPSFPADYLIESGLNLEVRDCCLYSPTGIYLARGSRTTIRNVWDIPAPLVLKE